MSTFGSHGSPFTANTRHSSAEPARVLPILHFPQQARRRVIHGSALRNTSAAARATDLLAPAPVHAVDAFQVNEQTLSEPSAAPLLRDGESACPHSQITADATVQSVHVREVTVLVSVHTVLDEADRLEFAPTGGVYRVLPPVIVVAPVILDRYPTKTPPFAQSRREQEEVGLPDAPVRGFAEAWNHNRLVYCGDGKVVTAKAGFEGDSEIELRLARGGSVLAGHTKKPANPRRPRKPAERIEMHSNRLNRCKGCVPREESTLSARVDRVGSHQLGKEHHELEVGEIPRNLDDEVLGANAEQPVTQANHRPMRKRNRNGVRDQVRPPRPDTLGANVERVGKVLEEGRGREDSARLGRRRNRGRYPHGASAEGVEVAA